MGVRIELFGKSGSDKSLLVENICAGLRQMGLSVSIPFDGGEYGHALDVAGAPGETIAETLFPGTHDKPAPKGLTPAGASRWRASRRGVRALERQCKRVMDAARLEQAIARGGLNPVREVRASFGLVKEPHNIQEGETLGAYLARTNSKPEVPEPAPLQPTDWPRLTLWGRWDKGKEEATDVLVTFDRGVSFVILSDSTVRVYTVEGHKFSAPRNDDSESAYRRWAECKR